MQMQKLLFVILLFTAAGGDTAADAEEVRCSSGDVRLTGLWFAPEGAGPFPAAIMIQGSGPSTRQNYWPRAILQILVDEGVAVLLPDKRGSDGAEGDWRTADFEQRADDTLAAIRCVQARPEVDSRRVGVIGLSQGGRIAPLAASRMEDIAFVINIAGSAVPFGEQISWEMYHTFRELGLAGSDLQEALALQITAEEYVRGRIDWNVYEAVLNEAKARPWRRAANGFPSTPDAWQWGFFRGVIDFDPLPFWERVRQPILTVYGEQDENAPIIRSSYLLARTLLRAGHHDWTVRVIPGVGHGLWQPESLHSHPTLNSEFAALLREWVRTRVVDE